MSSAAEERLQAWLMTYEPEDSDPTALAARFAEGLCEIGIAITRLGLWLPTAHPELWGTQVVWTAERGSEVILRPHEVAQTAAYTDSPGVAMTRERRPLRWRLADEEPPYPMLRELKAAGATDYLMVPFHAHHALTQPWASFATKVATGFTPAEIERMQALCVPMGWKTRVSVAEQSTRSLLRVYLGKNAAERVIDGQFRRGGGQSLASVIWFCDLRGFTALGDSMPASELVRLLDRYFECVAGPIEDGGGEILKFVGDAVLAVFPCEPDPRAATERALTAARSVLEALGGWSRERSTQGLAGLEMGISLHVGEVFYGNIGGRSRLDFTVIGAAVNEASRVESLCKEFGVRLLVTGSFADVLGREGLHHVGSRSLRGVRREQELFTLPELAPAST
jgi:adenylate cyclase